MKKGTAFRAFNQVIGYMKAREPDNLELWNELDSYINKALFKELIK